MIEFNNKIKKEDTNVTTSIEAVLRENSVILTTPISKPAGKDSPSLGFTSNTFHIILFINLFL